jgi:secretion/DNA translocation related TadE-like protein
VNDRARDGPRTGRGDEGAGTVLAVALIALVVAAAAMGAAVVEAVTVRHLAAGAADAGALAAAARAQLGPASACASAARIVRADGARLERCELSGEVATVTVSAVPPAPFGWQGAARLNARAGPAETYREKPTPLATPS